MIRIVYWILSAIVGAWVTISDKIQAAAIDVASKIPVPEFLQNISTDGLPDNTLFFMQVLEINYGLTVVISAMLLKITYRKILRLH